MNEQKKTVKETAIASVKEIIKGIMSCIVAIAVVLGTMALLTGCSDNATEAYKSFDGSSEVTTNGVDAGIDSFYSNDYQEILQNITEYMTCSVVYQKNLNYDNTRFLSDELIKGLENRNLMQAEIYCPYDCDQWLEEGYCEHTEEQEREAEENPPRMTYDQNDTIPWRNGLTRIADVNMGIVSSNVYDIVDSNDYLIIVTLVGESEKDQKYARATYSTETGKIEKITY